MAKFSGESPVDTAIDRPPRDRSVDVLKGLGIITIAMGHIDYAGVGGPFISYLYTFNVALFFTVAGFTWREKPGQTLWSALVTKFRQIYVPYIVLFVISILYGHIVNRYVFRQYVIPFEWKATLKAFLFSSEWLNSVPTFNFALWFLPLFFISSVIFHFLQKVRNRYIWTSIVVLILAASVPIQQLIPGRPIVNINVVPVAVVFMACGYQLKKRVSVERLNPLVLVLLAVFSLLAAYYFPGNVSGIGSYWFYPGALCSFILYLRVAQEVKSSSLLSYIGRNSLLIFGIHALIANTYPFTNILNYLSHSWSGLILYLVNLAYVVGGSVVVVMIYRKSKAVIAEAGKRWARVPSSLAENLTTEIEPRAIN